MFYDEFGVSAYPTLYYGWARRNTRPTVYWSSAQKRKRLNGLLAVDARSGEEYLALVPHATAEVLALYFYELACDSHLEGFQHLTIILDNNSTHKDAMRYQLWLRLKAHPDLQAFTIRFIDTPPYSPAFNLVEYVIHLLRPNVTPQNINNARHRKGDKPHKRTKGTKPAQFARDRAGAGHHLIRERDLNDERHCA